MLSKRWGERSRLISKTNATRKSSLIGYDSS